MPDTPDEIAPITSDARTAAEEFGAHHDRELLTILFTDLVDSTKLQSDLGNAEAARLTELHRKIVRDELAKYDAREIEWAGDSCLAVFKMPSDAVLFALRMQAEHRRVRESEAKLPTVRVGMHLGEIVVKMGKKKENLFGLQVSEAARVMSVAQGNQIFCTRAVFDNARGALKGSTIEGVGDVMWVNYGAYMLKGSEDPVELCEVGSNEVAVLRAPDKSDKVTPVSPPESSRKILATATAIGVGIVALLVVLQFIGRSLLGDSDSGSEPNLEAQEPKQVKRYLLGLNVAPLPEGGAATRVAISPDGSNLAYITLDDEGQRHLAVRRVDELEGEILPGTQGAWNPFFSPDGNSIGFVQGTRLKRIPISGDRATDVCEVGLMLGASWGEDGYIVFGSFSSEGLQRVRANGGTPESLVALEKTPGVLGHALPHVLPAGKGILFTTFSGFVDEHESPLFCLTPDGVLHSMPFKTGRVRYTSTGHIVYVGLSGLTARSFNADTFDTGSEPFSVPEKRMGGGKRASYDLSKNGTLVYIAEDKSSLAAAERPAARTLVWVDMDRNETAIEVLVKPYIYARISPDASQVALSDGSDIFLYEIAQKSLVAFAFDDDPEFTPVWSPDNEEIVYSSIQGGGQSQMFVKKANGTGGSMMVQPSQFPQFPQTWTPDGNTLIYAEFNPGTTWDLVIAHMGDTMDQFSEPVVKTPAPEGSPAISPDGKWLAYTSAVSDDLYGHVFVTSFPDAESKWLVSLDGGAEPVWAPDGSALYYRKENKMMRVPVEDGPTFKAGPPKIVWDHPYYADPLGGRSFDIHPDGDRFLMVKELGNRSGTQVDDDVIVIENWFEELKRIAPNHGKN